MARSANNHPLAKWRIDNGVTQGTLAGDLHVAPVTVWRWENGERSPRLKEAQAISDHTGIPVSELRSNWAKAVEESAQ